MAFAARVSAHPYEIWIVRGADRPPASARIPGPAAWRRLGLDDGERRSIVLDAAAALGPAHEHASLARRTFDDALRLVRDAIVTERLEVYEVLRPPVSAAIEPDDELEDREELERSVSLTFVSIELVDDSDPPRPLAGKRWCVELPDGSVREGTLDRLGRARIDGIEPGTCQVSFPEFHERAWRRA